MTSDKSVLTESRLNDLITSGGVALFGPWTAFNPLSNGWSVQSPFTAAWVRAAPGNMAILSFRMGVGTTTNGTVVGTIPATDADGNNLRPAQAVIFPVATDMLRINTGSNDEGGRFTIAADGTITCNGIAAAATVAHNCGHWYPLDAM